MYLTETLDYVPPSDTRGVRLPSPELVSMSFSQVFDRGSQEQSRF